MATLSLHESSLINVASHNPIIMGTVFLFKEKKHTEVSKVELNNQILHTISSAIKKQE